MNMHLTLILILSLWLAFWLRLWGFDFGLPYEFHPDEHQYVDAALRWHLEGQLQPGFINPPLFTYILGLAYWPWRLFSPLTASPEAIIPAYLLARWLSGAFGTLAVALAYPLGKRLYNRKVGILAAILLAGLFLPIREAHFAVNDTLAAFLAMLVIYLSLGFFRERGLRLYLLAGAVTGLATAAKLTAGGVILSLIVAHLLALKPKEKLGLAPAYLRPLKNKNLGLSLGMALAVYLWVSIHILGQLPEFIETIQEHLNFGTEGYKGLQMAPGSGWLFYLEVLSWGLGWLMLLAALLALGAICWRRYPPGLALAIFPLALFIYMGSQKILFARFLLPAVPPLVLLVALGLVWLEQWWPYFRQHASLLYPLFVGALLVQPLLYSLWFDYLLTLPDTRQLATAWLAAQLTEETVITRESYSILPQTLFLDNRWPYKVNYLDERGPTRNEPNYYLSHKTDLIVLSNFTFARQRQNPAEEAVRLEQLRLLASRATLLKTFNPYRQPDNNAWFYLDQIYGPAGETLQRLSPGPLIEIYQLPYENQPYTLAAPPIPAPVKVNFGRKLSLLGYDLPVRRVQPGEALPLTLYWQAEARLAENYVVFNRLLDDQQQAWGGYDRWPQETAKTSLWRPGEIVVDTFNLPVAAETPSGTYTVDIGLYDQADSSASPVPILNEGEATGQNSLRLGPVKVGGAPPEITKLAQTKEPQISLSLELGQPPVILLRGYELAQTEEALKLTLYWETLAQTPVDWSIFAHLRNATNETIAQKDGPAGGSGSSFYPSSLWDAGERVVDTLIIPLPAGLPVGNYTVVVGLYNLADGKRLAVPGAANQEISLTAWEWSQP